MQPLIATDTDLALLLTGFVIISLIIGGLIDTIRSRPTKKTGMATYKRRTIDRAPK